LTIGMGVEKETINGIGGSYETFASIEKTERKKKRRGAGIPVLGWVRRLVGIEKIHGTNLKKAL